MARERANINTAIWGDRDWRKLTSSAKCLYMLLLTHPTISYAGVVDWRPKKLAPLSPDTTPESLEQIASELQEARFIFVDHESEEVLIRSYLRHDGILKQPKLSVSMANAYSAISSMKVQDIVAFELQRLLVEYPDWSAWKSPKVQEILKNKGADISTFTLNAGQDLPLPEAGIYPTITPSANQAQGLPTTTSTTTSTYPLTGVSGAAEIERENGRVGIRIPKDFKATPEMIAWALEHCPNVNRQASTLKFKSHFNSAAGRAQFKTDWVEAWKAWLLGDQERAEQRPQQFKTATEKKQNQGAMLYAKYSAIEEQNQLAIEGGS